MDRPRITRKEYALLLLPVAFLCFLAVRASRAPQKPAASRPASKPFQLQLVKVERLHVTAQDVSRGADTKIRIRIATTGSPPQGNFNRWDWMEDVYVTADQNKQQRRITKDISDGTSFQKRILRGGSGGSSGSANGVEYVMTWFLRLQDVPVSRGALNFHCDVAYGPNVWPKPGETSAKKIRSLRQNGQALTIPVRVPLRKAGERIPPVHASTDPLFDVRKTEVHPRRPSKSCRKAKVVLYIFYRGHVSPMNRFGLPADCEWQLLDDQGRSYLHSTEGNIAQSTSGLRRFKIVSNLDTTYAHDETKGARRLYLRGFISVNRAWPRKVVIALPLRR